MEDKREFLRKVWGIFSPFKKYFAVALVLLMVSEVIDLAFPYIFGKIINLVTEQAPLSDVMKYAWLSFAIGVSTIGLAYFRARNEIRHLDWNVAHYLSKKTLDKLLSLSVGQHRSQHSGLTIGVINKGQGSIRNLVDSVLYEVLPIILQTLAAVIALLFFEWRVGMIALVGVVLFLLVSIYVNKKFRGRLRESEDRSQLIGKRHLEIVGNLSLVQFNAQEERIHDEHGSRLDGYANFLKKLWLDFVKIAAERNLISHALRFAVLVTGILLIYRGDHQPGDLVIMTMWTSQAVAGLGMLSEIHRRWMLQINSVSKYLSVLSVEPAVKTIGNPVRPNRFHGDIEFRDVSFTYPLTRYIEVDETLEEKEEVRATKPKLPALSQVNFSIKSGTRVALVGESGAGKSTIVNLLLRGYDPDQGQIFVDGHDIRLLDLHHFREHVGVVEQMVSLFDETLRYNILFGARDRDSLSDEYLDGLAKLSLIDRFSHRLTKGWDTPVGENGVQLSGGERQRIGIARALAKNPAILIFDEATSSLDGKVERLIKESLHNASQGRTTIIIAHRLSTVRDVDTIFLFDKGQVVAQGTHDELMETSEKYRELVESQTLA